MLIKRGGSVHVMDNEYNAPLHIAVDQGYEKAVQIFLQYNACIGFTNIYECAPLHIAVTKRNIEITKLLLEKGADVNLKATCLTALDIAKASNSKEMVQLLMEYGAELERYKLW
ncbi:MAG: hypothetical protein PG981_001469 [Wolbachia endosymbiont of Ctenocephalides orientis wCori]|nr:MAG: hypothetical protein PG981_001469 [Wolbachia endosymbiont of Ctenocephalides orientis wCori]